MNASPAGRPATTYHILRELETAEAKIYEPAGAGIEASSADEAIRKSVTEPGTYIAIPSRSFKTVTVQVETKTTLKLT